MKLKNIIKTELTKILKEAVGYLNPEGLSNEDYNLIKKAWDINDPDSTEFENLINQCQSDDCIDRIKKIRVRKHHEQEYWDNDL